MRGFKTKRSILNRATSSLLVLGIFIVACSPLAYAARPYFKAFGADVFTGGWFNQGASLCSSDYTNYQDPTAPAATQTGGVVAYTRTNSSGIPSGGASSQYAALSLGLIDGTWNGQNGFYSSGATGSSNPANRLSFSNYDDGTGSSMQFGGKFQGAVRQGHCIPDYFTIKGAADATPVSAIPDISTAVGNYSMLNPSGVVAINSSHDTIVAGNVLTIFVNGNVFIHSNISYSGSSTASSVPKFALVVRGSIYIGPTVTQLDGLYIAQPDSAASPMTRDTGIIWTCHPNSSSQYTLFQMATNCGSKLTINGALIAKQVNFLRTPGDTATATAGEVSTSANIAEVINYTPAMVIDGPFFGDSSTIGSLDIQSLVSLPPTF